MLLNKKFLETNKISSSIISIGSLRELPEKIIQFGEGNFLRAFVDWQFNELNKKNIFNGKIIVVQPLENGKVNELKNQDGLFTLLLRGLKDRKKIEQLDLITSVSRGINPYTNWDEFLKCASIPELRYIVSNTTEAGIEYKKINKPTDECPVTFPAKVTAFLYERFKIFSNDVSKGMIILPCELIENNGDELKQCIIKHSYDWNLGLDFIDWLEHCNYFFNTLVDRIVPGYPKDEIKELTEKLGYEDKLLDSGEIYYLWIIQGDKKFKDELPFHKAGLNVIWTSDLTPYRNLKVHILNGAHTMFAIPAFLAGKDYVKEAVEDNFMGKFIKTGLYNEILPTLDFPEDEKIKFADNVIERFQNPFIKHYLMSITLNSVSKFKVRVLPSLKKYYQIKNELPEVLSFSLASLIVFYTSYLNNGSLNNAEFGDLKYSINDDKEILNFFYSLKQTFKNDIDKMVRKILGNINLWDEDLNHIEGLTERISQNIRQIEDAGMKEAIKEFLKSKETKNVIMKERNS